MTRHSLQDFETDARHKLCPAHYDCFAGGAQDEVTLRENRAAFERIRLRPRILRGGFRGDLKCRLLGIELDMPILIAPTAFHRLASDEGECGTARAAREAGTVMVISMASNTAMEEIVAAAAATELTSRRFWFQLYIQPDRGFTAELVQRAEASGCGALVLTVDSPVFGRHERDLRNGFADLPAGLDCPHMRGENGGRGRKIEFQPNLNWDDIDWLSSLTQLPLVLKGVAHPDDARQAMEHGARALMVSNHGGRQLDSVAASIDLLPAVADAVQDEIPIILDGGIRRGTDIVKALAFGATAVAIGRPVLWGLAAGGQQGVMEMLRLLRTELLEALLLCGCESLQFAGEDVLFPDAERPTWRPTCP